MVWQIDTISPKGDRRGFFKIDYLINQKEPFSEDEFRELKQNIEGVIEDVYRSDIDVDDEHSPLVDERLRFDPSYEITERHENQEALAVISNVKEAGNRYGRVRLCKNPSIEKSAFRNGNYSVHEEISRRPEYRFNKSSWGGLWLLEKHVNRCRD